MADDDASSTASTEARWPRGTLILASIGLVVVGLLAGILLTLLTQEAPSTPTTPARASNPVELSPRPAASDPAPRSVDSARSEPVSMPEPTALNRLFRDVAKDVTPGVVFIQVQTEGGEGETRRFEGDMRDFFRNPTPRRSVGSGVIISAEGHIVTNNHVVENAERIQVTLADKREYRARVVGRDASTDLAVLKIDGKDGAEAPFTPVPLGNSNQVGVGDWVVAVGNPFRLTSTVTAGIVSALGRQVNIIDNTFRIEDFIQTDAAINPGNSGGALVNLRGELIGVNTAIATESGSYEGYGFAVPSNLVERVAEDLIAYGEVRRGFLGVSISEVNAERAEQLGMDRIRGVYVSNVTAGSAAAQAGIESGDVIVRVQERSTDAPNELQSVVTRYRPGDRVSVTVWRDGTEQQVSATLMSRDAPALQAWSGEQGPPEPQRREGGPSEQEPEATPETSSPEKLDGWGMGVRTPTRAEQRAFGTEAGLYVAYVQNGSRADTIGVPNDVLLTRVGDRRIGSVEAARQALAALADRQAPTLLEVRRRDGTRAFYEVD